QRVRLPRRRAVRLRLRLVPRAAEARRTPAPRARPEDEEGLAGDGRRRARTRLSGDARGGTHHARNRKTHTTARPPRDATGDEESLRPPAAPGLLLRPHHTQSARGVFRR